MLGVDAKSRAADACLTCGKFATDASFLPELRVQKERTLTLIDSRQAAFTARTGTPMAPGNVWLDGRQREADALGAIITALESAPEASQAVFDMCDPSPRRFARTCSGCWPAAWPRSIPGIKMPGGCGG